MKLQYKKLYKKGGGGYITRLQDGTEVAIEKQYIRGTWVAQGGDIDIEAERLDSIKYQLNNINLAK